jgi:hypothetical protein
MQVARGPGPGPWARLIGAWNELQTIVLYVRAKCTLCLYASNNVTAAAAADPPPPDPVRQAETRASKHSGARTRSCARHRRH